MMRTLRFEQVEPLPSDELDSEEAEPLPPIDVEIDFLEIQVGTRTLMGVGARAVRAVATSGCVEARPARRGLRATPEAPYPQVMRLSIDTALPRVIVSPEATPEATIEGSGHRALAHGSSQAPTVEPSDLPQEELPLEALLQAFSPAGAQDAPVADPAPKLESRAHWMVKRASPRPGARGLGTLALGVAFAALAASVAAAMLYVLGTL